MNDHVGGEDEAVEYPGHLSDAGAETCDQAHVVRDAGHNQSQIQGSTYYCRLLGIISMFSCLARPPSPLAEANDSS